MKCDSLQYREKPLYSFALIFGVHFGLMGTLLIFLLKLQPKIRKELRYRNFWLTANALDVNDIQF